MKVLERQRYHGLTAVHTKGSTASPEDYLNAGRFDPIIGIVSCTVQACVEVRANY